MSEATRIILAGREFNVPPLTIRQSRAIDVYLAKPLPEDPVAQADASWERMLSVIALALGPAYPDFTVDKIMDGPGTVDTVAEAYRTVLGMLGLKPAPAKTDASSGEAPAQPGPAPA